MMLFDNPGQEDRIGSCKHYAWFRAIFDADFEKAKELMVPCFLESTPDQLGTPLPFAIMYGWDDAVLFLIENDTEWRKRLDGHTFKNFEGCLLQQLGLYADEGQLIKGIKTGGIYGHKPEKHKREIIGYLKTLTLLLERNVFHDELLEVKE